MLEDIYNVGYPSMIKILYAHNRHYLMQVLPQISLIFTVMNAPLVWLDLLANETDLLNQILGIFS